MADKPGDRARRLAAAAVPVHQFHRRPGLYTRMGIAVCGAKREDGAEFTTWARYVTCPECRAAIAKRRAMAKARFAAITGALALLLTAGCGDNLAPDLTGAWAYTWPAPQMVLHGTMTLAQSCGVATGTVDAPVELGGADDADWGDWSVTCAVTSERADCYAVGPTKDRPWWWELTVTGDMMAGPEYTTLERLLQPGTFSAVRE